MNNADILAVLLIILFTAAGAFLGFTRGLFSFLGVFFGCKFAAMQAQGGAPANKFLGILFGCIIVGVVVGFLFYGATKFTPMDAMDNVFGAIFGFLFGWGVCYGIFYYYDFFKPDSPFTQMIRTGKVALPVYEIKPWAEFMRRMEKFRNPDPF